MPPTEIPRDSHVPWWLTCKSDGGKEIILQVEWTGVRAPSWKPPLLPGLSQ